MARLAVARASQQGATPLTLVPLKHVPLERVPYYMNGSSALLMTSFIEGSPNVVKEAMACNLPVISVPVGDVAEQLAGVDGCAVVPRDPAVIAAALLKALTSGRRSDGRRALIARSLDQLTVARRLVAIYSTVLAGWSGRTARSKVVSEKVY